MSASEQIAAAAKKSRPKAAPKTCGVSDCHNEAAAGGKLRLTVLEPASLYPGAVEGKLSACKPHKLCVGFFGFSPEVVQGSALHPTCNAAAKVFYLSQAFCEGCHNVYLEA